MFFFLYSIYTNSIFSFQTQAQLYRTISRPVRSLRLLQRRFTSLDFLDLDEMTMMLSKRSFSWTKTLREQVKEGTKRYDHSNIQYGALSKAQKAYLDRVIRVDQAGELGANFIYFGQFTVLASKYPHLRPILQHMWDQEVHHHDTFNKLQVERRVRPSLFTPLWKLGAIGMGAGTALISKEAAMACTVAVETVIGGHYNEQLRVLQNQYGVSIYDKETGEPLPAEKITRDIAASPEILKLKELVSTFRDEELEHLDTAIEHDAEKAVPYMLLTEAIKVVCKGAIWSAERI